MIGQRHIPSCATGTLALLSLVRKQYLTQLPVPHQQLHHVPHPQKRLVPRQWLPPPVRHRRAEGSYSSHAICAKANKRTMDRKVSAPTVLFFPTTYTKGVKYVPYSLSVLKFCIMLCSNNKDKTSAVVHWGN
eukprot:13704202-Ditylum_brightwellii.AAC.2